MKKIINEIEKFEMKSNYLGNDILWKKCKSGTYSVANPDDIKSLTKQILKAQNEKLHKISPLGTCTALDLIRENEKLIDDIKN